MKKKSLLVLALMLPSLLCTASCVSYKKPHPKNITPDSTVYSKLGRTMSEVLFNPTSVTCYTLKGDEIVDPTKYQVEPHWVRDSLVGRLTPQMQGILQFALLANKENYKYDSLQSRAPYIPVLEFEFRQKRNVVHVLISLQDNTWTIMYDDKQQVHFNYQDKELINRFCEIFLQSTK